MAKKSWRKIHFNNEEIWEYRITKSWVLIKDPNEKREAVSMPEFLKFFGYNWDWDTIERSRYKGYWLEIEPSDIKLFIEDRFR